MQNRISDTTERQDRLDDAAHPIGEILEELLAQYERRYPDIHIAIVQTASTAV